jgi:hypothetical protein
VNGVLAAVLPALKMPKPVSGVLVVAHLVLKMLRPVSGVSVAALLALKMPKPLRSRPPQARHSKAAIQVLSLDDSLL